jgi:hypothetical protein
LSEILKKWIPTFPEGSGQAVGMTFSQFGFFRECSKNLINKRKTEMKRLNIMLLAVVLMTASLLAQTQFDKDAAVFHKKAIMVCGIFKTQNPNAEQVSNLISSASEELRNLAQKYKDNPPAEYKNDPLWQTYFEDWADNLTLVKTFAEQKNYKLVSKYCNTFCQIFVRMHKNNGTTDLTDLLFTLNMQLKLTTDISNAGNIKGVKENIGMLKNMLKNTSAKVNSISNKNIEEMYSPLQKTAQSLIKAFEDSNSQKADSLYASFMKDFPKLFLASTSL